MGRRTSVLLLLVGLGAWVSACSSEKESASSAATTSSSTQQAQAAQTARDCTSSVGGELRSDWRERGTVIAGPLALAYVLNNADVPAADFAPRGDGRYIGVKVLAVVEAGASVTLLVPEGERERLSLLYLPRRSDDGLYRVADGTPLVTFDACPDRETQFNGGFVVAGAQCARVEIQVEGETSPMWRELPFGTECS